jgi:hypothetical protein
MIVVRAAFLPCQAGMFLKKRPKDILFILGQEAF